MLENGQSSIYIMIKYLLTNLQSIKRLVPIELIWIDLKGAFNPNQCDERCKFPIQDRCKKLKCMEKVEVKD
jgi:hypothetical protein